MSALSEPVGRAVAITVSTRASAGVYPDRSGPTLVQALRGLGFSVDDPVLVPDGPAVRDAVQSAVAAGADLVVTTGGTGVSADDLTPEMTRPLLDREIPGIAEALRSAAWPTVPAAMLSRGVAGTVGRTLVVNLPGSVGGVRDGMAVLAPVLRHVLGQLRGGDHEHSRPSARCQVVHTAVSGAPISAEELVRLVEHASAGAVATFSGIVRDHDGGRSVRRLEYVAHPSAAPTLADIAAELAVRSDARALAVAHRVGPLAIGDVALACAVSSSHRREAFDLCRDVVEAVKARLPIWKLQVFADGTEEWVGCP